MIYRYDHYPAYCTKADVEQRNTLYFEQLMTEMTAMQELHFVLIEFPPKPASHLERSTLKHSHGYVPAVDRPTCLAGLTGIPDPLMQYVG